MEFEDAGFVIGILPHFLERVPPTILGVVALVEARLGIPASEEDDSLGPLPSGVPDRADIAGEGVFLEVEEQLLQRVRPAPGRPDEFSLWEQEVLGRRVPSAAVTISEASLNRFQPSFPV